MAAHRVLTRTRAVMSRVAVATRACAPAQMRAFADVSSVKAGSEMTSSGMYNWRVAAVHNALAKRGKDSGPLTVDDLISLGHLDQYHYMGVEACDEVIKLLGIDATSKIIDVGSGIGGPARYLSMRTGCDITGVELQKDLTEASTDLTARVGLSNKVRFLTGDFVKEFGPENRQQHGKYDHLISLLVFLHIPDRAGLLQACYNSLAAGGTFVIEDFAQVGNAFTARESDHLKNVVSAPTVTSPEVYVADLEAAGFVDIQVSDKSKPWTAWTKARHESYRAAREDTVKDHGEKIYNDRVAFYEVIDELFAGGNLGGVRITGRKRSLLEEKLHNGRRVVFESNPSAVLNEYGSTVSR
mmetsp:Transcript_23176/g.37046  ORF Transcript_23176/g.37046 Transcript_23176/m.37046 type:complete len:355 (-) Transcript_23176:64-1128(-)